MSCLLIIVIKCLKTKGHESLFEGVLEMEKDIFST